MADLLFTLSGILVLAALLLSFIRLLSGPSMTDRAVALDSMTIMSLSVIVLMAFFFKRSIYLDVALVYAILSFLGVVALARYLERGL